MASSPQPPKPPEPDLDQIKKQKEIDKLDLEIGDLSKAGKRFAIGSVAIPLIVAFVTLAIFGATGFFDTHEKLIEIAKHDFKEDTLAYNKTKANILSQISLLRKDSAILRDSIGVLKAKMRSYDSLVGFVYKNAKGKDRIILNLADSNAVLRQMFANEAALRKITSDSIKPLIQTIMDQMGQIGKLMGQRELIYDLRHSVDYYMDENAKLHKQIDSLRSSRR